MAALSEREVRVLAFERGWWRSPGAKEQEIRDVLGMTRDELLPAAERADRPPGGADARSGPGQAAAAAAGPAAQDAFGLPDRGDGSAW